jgi:hypothetical protein
MGDELMKFARAGALIVGFALGASLCVSAVSAQTESANAEDGKPASDAPADTAPAPNAPLGANLTPPLGALPPVPPIISGPGSGQPGSSSVSMAPGTLTSGVAHEGTRAVRAPKAEPAPDTEVAPAPVEEAAPEPVADTPVAETSEPVVEDSAAVDTTAASETDLDADNYPDELEWDLGLDPTNIDTDADGVADGDEITIYGTDPTTADSDGDGIVDGGELYDTRTDPLVWDDFAPASDEVVAQETTEATQPVE